MALERSRPEGKVQGVIDNRLRRAVSASGPFSAIASAFASGCSPPRLSVTQLPSATDSQRSVRFHQG